MSTGISRQGHSISYNIRYIYIYSAALTTNSCGYEDPVEDWLCLKQITLKV